MERAYKLMYNSEDKLYSFPDFSYKFRTNHVEKVAPEALYWLVAKCKWLHEAIPEPTQTEGETVIIEEDIVCEDYLLHEEGFLGALRRISCAGDAAVFATMEEYNEDVEIMDNLLIDGELPYGMQAEVGEINGSTVLRWMMRKSYADGAASVR